MVGGVRGRRSALGIGALIAIGLAILMFPTQVGTAATSGAQVSTTALAAAPDALTAPAQSALDQVLGPGHSVITASATYSNPSSRLTTSYNAKQSATLAGSTVSGPAGQSSVTADGVGSTVTDTTDPGGKITHLTVAVVIDSTLRPLPSTATIRHTVAAAMGLRPGRGDKITVAALPMAAPAVAVGSATGTARFTPYGRSALCLMLAAGLLLALAAEVLGGSRRRSSRVAPAATRGAT